MLTDEQTTHLKDFGGKSEPKYFYNNEKDYSETPADQYLQLLTVHSY